MALTDAEYEATKARIQRVTDKWALPCGLRHWNEVTFEYHRDTSAMADACQVPISEHQRYVAGRAHCDWRYKTATIHLNLSIIFRLSDAELDYVIRHEICHLLVNEMREWQSDHDGSGQDHEERVVTELAMALGWVWKAGYDEATTQTGAGPSSV